jgi:hypothetical protein
MKQYPFPFLLITIPLTVGRRSFNASGKSSLSLAEARMRPKASVCPENVRME